MCAHGLANWAASAHSSDEGLLASYVADLGLLPSSEMSCKSWWVSHLMGWMVPGVHHKPLTSCIEMERVKYMATETCESVHKSNINQQQERHQPQQPHSHDDGDITFIPKLRTAHKNQHYVFYHKAVSHA